MYFSWNLLVELGIDSSFSTCVEAAGLVKAIVNETSFLGTSAGSSLVVLSRLRILSESKEYLLIS